MLPSMIGADELSAAVKVLHDHDSVRAAYLLGSAAAGRLRPDSDIDVAILPQLGSPVPIEERLALTAALGRIFRRDVDIGFLSTSNLVYAKEAITTGRLLFDREPLQTAEFAMHALSMYAALQDERREVLHVYAA